MNLSQWLQKHHPFRNYKSFSHWFSYHWRPVLAAALLLAVAIYYRSLPQAPQPDYEINWVGSQLLSQEKEASLTETVRSLGADVNGDGEILVEIHQYAIIFDASLEGEQLSESYNYLTKLMNSIQVGDCRLFLLEDPEGFQRSTGILEYLDGSIPGEADGYECARWEEMCLPVTVEGFDQDLYLGRCAIFQEESAETLYPGADALFEAWTGLDS